MKNEVILYDCEAERWLHFQRPLRVVEIHRPEGIRRALQEIEERVERDGVHAAGFLSYEASPAFDPACITRPETEFPLLWFGLYEKPQVVDLPPLTATTRPSWGADLDERSVFQKISSIKDAIARGETYQVNYTFSLQCDFRDDPWHFFLHLMQGQTFPYAAYVDTGRFAICSASPELFFERRGTSLRARPMKGTAPRGLTLQEDRDQAARLGASGKDRAENLMILDMIRNDLGRLGAVQVPELFTVERHPTVWQMTSTAVTQTEASLEAIFTALFPCASITGAPKYRTMQIISELESRPRRIYTGCIGHIAPGRNARFSVAIRTALIDREEGRGEYGVGAGITWDSEARDEYRECLQKARILHQAVPSFSLLESLLWTPADGYFLLDEHLQRMADSALYFDRPWRREAVVETLESHARSLSECPHKVRLLLCADGTPQCEASPLADGPAPVRLGLAKTPVSSQDLFLFHKTTHRDLYQKARLQCPGCDDVLLWNERREVTETTTANIVVELHGELMTPSFLCGLLPGVFRSHLLASGKVKEGVVTLEDLPRCRRIYLVNSVRGWREARLADGFTSGAGSSTMQRGARAHPPSA